MVLAGVDTLLVSVGSDLPYLTGYRAMPLERLTMLVLPAAGEPVLVVPELEVARVTPHEAFTIRAWSETEDPVAIVADLAAGSHRAAIGDQTWARFVLALDAAMPDAALVSAGDLMSALRRCKAADEVRRLRAAAEAADDVIARLAEMPLSGSAERAVAREITEMMLVAGHETVEFAIVASGPNGSSPHHEPTDRLIESGDAIVVDIGGRRDGYCSDTSRTFHVGRPDPAYARAYEVLHRAQEAGVAAVRPGVPAQEIDRAARAVIEAAGYGDRFIHRTGHGIGLDPHEAPYLVEGNDEVLAEGMSFSVEPGIYQPGGWGMRIEDIVVVTADGVDRLNTSDRRLYIVG
jgi:Xaa-Pro aminopeptidase